MLPIAFVTELQNFYTAYKQIHQFDEFKTVITDGVGWFTDIPQGLYLIYQKTAAPGYQKLPAFLVTVPFKDELDVTVVSKPELELDAVPETTGPEPTEGDKDDDKDEEKLPQTGQLTWPIPWLTVSGLAFFVLGWYLCFGRREELQ